MGGTEQDTLRITTSDNVGIGYRVAGLATRLIAAALDGFIVVVLLVLAYLLMVLIISAAGSDLESVNIAAILIGAVEFFLLIFYFTIAEVVTGGRSPGKKAMGVRVIRLDGGAPGFGECFLRNLAFLVDVGLGLGPILMFFHPNGRRVGDLIAGTVVASDRAEVTLSGVISPSPVLLRSNDPGPRYPGFSQLTARDFSAVRTLLSRPQLAPDQRAKLAWLIAGKLFDRLGIPPGAPERGMPPELFLERVYMQMAPEHGP